FIWKRNGKLEGLICIYVDDFLWAGNATFKKCVIDELQKQFLIGSSASESFTYVGLRIKSFSDGITIDQTQYASSLVPVTISSARNMQRESTVRIGEDSLSH
ncbi:unnamed protein product, partial [Meganyctiphanes norvegica]